MSAGKPLDNHIGDEHAFGRLPSGKRETITAFRTDTACTADENLTFVLGVEIDEVFSPHETRLHPFGTGETGLLVAGEDTFYRTMLDVLRKQQCHFHSYTNTVVSTQCSSLGLHPLAVDIGLYGILLEIEIHILVLLANHIHMALEYHGLAVLITWCCSLSDDDVSGFVNLSLQSEAFAELAEKGYHLLFALRRAGYLIHLCKAVEHCLWFKSGHSCHLFL